MGRERHAKCDSVAGIPSAARAHSIYKHAAPEMNTLAKLVTSAKTTLASLLKRNECECSGDDPAGSPRHPAPAELSRIELHVVINRAEFPAPEPVCFAASCFQQPLDAPCYIPLGTGRGRHQSYNRKSRGPAPGGLVAEGSRPASILVLQMFDHAQSSFNVSTWLMPQRQDRKAGWFNSVLTGAKPPGAGVVWRPFRISQTARMTGAVSMQTPLVLIAVDGWNRVDP